MPRLVLATARYGLVGEHFMETRDLESTMDARLNARERSAHTIVLLLALIGSILLLPAGARASGLECPTTATGLIADDSQVSRMTSGNDADLAKEIDGLIERIMAEAPRAGIAEIGNSLIGAYCPVVAQMTTISAQEKWQLMRQFDRVLMQQLSATAMPKGSLIFVNVPLPPAIYEMLRIQAKASGQQTTDFVAAILTRAARQ
jgi:hypothetical protein